MPATQLRKITYTAISRILPLKRHKTFNNEIISRGIMDLSLCKGDFKDIILFTGYAGLETGCRKVPLLIGRDWPTGTEARG